MKHTVLSKTPIGQKFIFPKRDTIITNGVHRVFVKLQIHEDIQSRLVPKSGYNQYDAVFWYMCPILFRIYYSYEDEVVEFVNE